MIPSLSAALWCSLGSQAAFALKQGWTYHYDGYFWSGQNGNQLRTGHLGFEVPNLLEVGPTWQWHPDDSSAIRSAPLIDDQQNIYVASAGGTIHKLGPTGATLWSHSEQQPITGSPAIWEGALFAAGQGGSVFALDMESGRKLWTSTAGSSTSSDPWAVAVGEGVVVVSGGNGAGHDHVAALDAKNGTAMWRYSPDAPLMNFVGAITHGSVLFADAHGAPYRVSLATGELEWKTGAAGPKEKVRNETSTGGCTVGANGVMYCTSNSQENWAGNSKVGHVTAFNIRSGEMFWRQAIEYEANTPPAIGWLTSNRRLAVVIGAGANPTAPGAMAPMRRKKERSQARVLALDAGTGGPLWSYNMPAWAGNAIGELRQNVCHPTSFGNPVIDGDGTVFVGYENGELYALRDVNNDGELAGQGEVHKYKTDHAFQGSPALSPNTLVASNCKQLFVYRSNMQI